MSTLRASHKNDLQAQRGLPEPLPAGERILWQGSPDPKLLARDAFHTRKLALYFALLLALRGGFVLANSADVWLACKAVLWVLPVFAAAWGAIAWLAYLTAVTSVYTITDKRVVMRIGIVLSLTFNLPFRQIVSAGIKSAVDGKGDIALMVVSTTRLAYLNFWPHVKPWQLSQAQPMLRCINQVEKVATILAEAWAAATAHGTAVVVPAQNPHPRPPLALPESRRYAQAQPLFETT
jgi:hypothetical protein